MEDFLFYLVIAIIGFISWIWRKAQEVAAARQRRALEREAKRQGRVLEPEEPEDRESAEDALRRIYEALGAPPGPEAPEPPPLEEIEEVEPVVKRMPVKKKPEVKRPKLTADQQAALKRVQSGQLEGPSGRRKRQGRSGVVGATNARELIRSSGGLREAIVLKEILDKPLSMRS